MLRVYDDSIVHLQKICIVGSSLMYLIVQIDSWWYYKGPENGVKNWTAKPSIFPNGIEAVAKKTGWPIEAHNRWW